MLWRWLQGVMIAEMSMVSFGVTQPLHCQAFALPDKPLRPHEVTHSIGTEVLVFCRGSSTLLLSVEAPPLPFTNSPPSRRHAKGYFREGLGLVREAASERGKATPSCHRFKLLPQEDLQTGLRNPGREKH